MFCPKCGREVHDGSSICNTCGTDVSDKGGFKYGFLGFLFPIVGVIIYYMLKDKEPKLCESFKVGAIVGLIMYTLMTSSFISLQFMTNFIK